MWGVGWPCELVVRAKLNARYLGLKAVEEERHRGSGGAMVVDLQADEETAMCWPNGMFLGVIFGEEPWPDSMGGYVELLGDVVEDPLTGLGLGIQLGLSHYLGDSLIEFGETGDLIGLPFQGLGYKIGFGGDAAGAMLGGLGEAVDGATDVVGEVVDVIGEVVEDAWDGFTSWF